MPSEKLTPERVARALGWRVGFQPDPEAERLSLWVDPSGKEHASLPPLRELILSLEPGEELDALVCQVFHIYPDGEGHPFAEPSMSNDGAMHLLSVLERKRNLQRMWLPKIERVEEWLADPAAKAGGPLGWSVELRRGRLRALGVGPVWRPSFAHAVCLAALLSAVEPTTPHSQGRTE